MKKVKELRKEFNKSSFSDQHIMIMEQYEKIRKYTQLENGTICKIIAHMFKLDDDKVENLVYDALNDGYFDW